jgi:hypothetical protein
MGCSVKHFIFIPFPLSQGTNEKGKIVFIDLKWGVKGKGMQTVGMINDKLHEWVENPISNYHIK